MYDIIVSYDKISSGIGCKGILPWPSIERDMIRFNEITAGKTIVMGRNTFEALGKPLPGRYNVVISSKKNFHDIRTFNSLETALNVLCNNVVVIGGESIFNQCFNNKSLFKKLHMIYVTEVTCTGLKFDSFLSSFLSEDFEILKSEIHLVSNNPVVSEINFIDAVKKNHDENNYLTLCREILSDGHILDTRTGIKTKSLFSKTLRFDLTDDTIPILTTKLVFFRGVIEEMLFFVSGKTDVKILQYKGVHIWDENTSKKFISNQGLNYEEGDIGVSYSFQFRHAGAEREYQGKDKDYTGMGVDQITKVINQLKSPHHDRRTMINLWSSGYINKMTLPPCLFCYMFYKIGDSVSMKAVMRSADIFLGVPFNIMGSCILLRMICHLARLKAKEMVIDICDAHLYENHIDGITEQLTRTPYPFPTLEIIRSPEEIKDIDGFKYSDFKIKGYNYHPPIKAKMAV